MAIPMGNNEIAGEIPHLLKYFRVQIYYGEYSIYAYIKEGTMRTKILALLALTVVALFLSGCFTTPIAATGNPIGSKIGSASCVYILSFLPLGEWNNGVYKAAKNGGISRIATVDHQLQFFYFFSISTTVVSGE
jgi:hypothetical protein